MRKESNLPPVVPVILSGGCGTRLWPLSRQLHPKQFLPLTSPRTMLQDTLLRCRSGDGLFAAPILVANSEHRFIAAEQMRQIGIEDARLMLEPEGRGTAPAAAAAAALVERDDAEGLMLVLPSDHLIGDVGAFHGAVRQGREAALEGALVTFGIAPTEPATGYGYIRRGEALNGSGLARVAGFVEKPERESAARMVESGEVLWNSGMFLFRADVFLGELSRHAPDIPPAARAAVAGARHDRDFLHLAAKPFAAAPALSIDHAVMERTDRAAVLPVDMRWSDVGAWSELWAVAEKDQAGNVLVGDVMAQQARNCLVRSDSGALTAVVGVDDLIVVSTADAVLVASRAEAQAVKGIVERLQAAGRPEAVVHRRVYRPWGWYQVLHAGERFQVKCLSVKPGAKLSVQMHYHRAEHWVVVNGTARITRGEAEELLHENQSAYIPAGTVHALENPGKIPLNLIEVQSGGYLGEDDIVRLSDTFGRA